MNGLENKKSIKYKYSFAATLLMQLHDIACPHPSSPSLQSSYQLTAAITWSCNRLWAGSPFHGSFIGDNIKSMAANEFDINTTILIQPVKLHYKVSTRTKYRMKWAFVLLLFIFYTHIIIWALARSHPHGVCFYFYLFFSQLNLAVCHGLLNSDFSFCL